MTQEVGVPVEGRGVRYKKECMGKYAPFTRVGSESFFLTFEQDLS